MSRIAPPALGEELILARITRATRPVIACDLKSGVGGELSACVFNSSVKPQQTVALRTVPADNLQPQSAQSAPISVEIPVHDGVIVSAPLSVASELEVELATSP